MRIEKTKSAIKNISFGLINKILGMLLTFAIKTIIIYKLGVEYLGLNSLFASILNVLNFTEIGFGMAIAFSMYKPIAEDDTETICALLNLYKKIYRVVGCIVLAFGLAVMPFLKYLISGNVPADINLYALYSIYLFNTSAGYFFFAYKSSLFSAYQKTDILSIIAAIVNLLCHAFQVAVLFIFPNYYVYIIFTPIATIVNNLVIGFIAKKKYPNLNCKGSVSKEKAKEIRSQVFGLMYHKISTIVQSSIDNIAISAFLGLTVLGVYNNYIYLQSSIQSFITIFFTSIIAGLGNNIQKDSKENNYKLFMRLYFACAAVVIFCTSCLLSLYQPFMIIWDRVNSPLNISVVILMCIMFYVVNIRSVCMSYREALGIWNKDKLRPFVITVVNLIGTLTSASLGSLDGIVISTIISYAVFSIYWETDVLYRYYFNQSKKEYFLKLVFYTVIATIVCTITYFLTGLIKYDGILWFLAKMAICGFSTLFVLFLCTFWTKEFKYWFYKIFKKNKNNLNK